ncbi:MAG TPA: tetratricopeptide repeat protein [Steroidobacteraceae bacterium]|nr:tetratricopeptide repeat protein [Steroidobacteraceae bacterium]
MKRCAALVAMASIWAGDALAADKIAFGPIPNWVQPVAALSTIPGTAAPLQILLQDRETQFSDRGQQGFVEMVLRIQSTQGLQQAGTFTLNWDPDTDIVTVHKFQILRGTQRIDVLASQKFTIARREKNLEYATLDGMLTGVIQPAGLQIGDILDVAYSVRRIDPVLAGVSNLIIETAGTAPVARAHIRVQWPKSLALQWRAMDGAAARQMTQGNTIIVDSSEDNVAALVQPKDVPQRYALEPRLEFTSFNSWEQAATRLSPIFERATTIKRNSPLLAEIARIRAASPDPKVRAAMALSLVETQVRYLFLAMNQGGLVPATPDQTWLRRFGDCKAKTVLLTAMLRSLGIDAEPVVVSTTLGGLLPVRLPNVMLFDHVLVRSVIEGRTYWLDGTRSGDQSLTNLTVPYYQWGLPLTAVGATLVSMVPPPPPAPLTETLIQIDAAAGITTAAPFHAEAVARGDAGMALKLRLDTLAPNQLEQGLRQFWAQQYNFVQVKAVSARFDSADASEHLVMDGTAQMDWSANQYTTDGLGVGFQADFERTDGPHHDAPFLVPYPVYNHVSERITLPDGGIGFSVAGQDVDSTVAGIQYQRHAVIKDGIFSADASQRALATEFPASEATADQKALRDLARNTLYVNAPGGFQPTAADVAAGISKDTKNADDLLNRGNTLINRNRWDDAIADFDAELALDPKNATGLADRALIYLHKQDLTRARRDIDSAAHVDAHNQILLHARGVLAQMTHDLPEAIGAFDEVLKTNPKDIFALETRGTVKAQQGDIAGALKDIDDAIAISPRAVNLYWYRALWLRSEGEKQKALQQPALILKVHPNDADAYAFAAQLYATLGEPEQARATLNRSIQLKPTEAAYMFRAQMRQPDDWTRRRADYAAAVNLDPTSGRDLTALALADEALGNYGEAISTASRAIATNGATAGILAIRGIAYSKSHQSSAAEQDFQQAEAKAQDANAMNNLCWELATADAALDRALKLCDSAVAKGPGKGRAQAAYLDSRGFVLLRLGRFKEAIASYDQALAIAPLLPNSLYGRGICELRTGATKAAADDIHDGKVFSKGTVAAAFRSYGISPQEAPAGVTPGASRASAAQ